MICVSIAEATADGCIRALKGVKGAEMAEIRLDLMKQVSARDVENIFSLSQPARLIATCRPNDKMDDEERGSLLAMAIGSGAAYVDIEIDSGEDYRKMIMEKARSKGCKIIVSYHDYNGTPQAEELRQIVERCFESGADIAKIACMVNTGQDNARLLGLLDMDGREGEGRIVVVGMGEKGRITRVAGPLLGSPFTLASLERGKETAKGQMDAASLGKLLDEIRGKEGKEQGRGSGKK